MKSTIIFSLAIVISYGLCAQPEIDKRPTRINRTDVHMTRPVKDIEKTPLLSGTNGIYIHSWKLQDGTKVTSTFDIGTGIAMTKPHRNSTNTKKTKRDERNQREENDDSWNCITKETRITLANDDYMTVDNGAQAAHIYPGAIIKFNNYVSGSWKEEDGGRNPITISTPMRNVNGETMITIENPSVSTIRNGINILSNRFPKESSLMANGTFQMKAVEVFNQAEVSLEVGASGGGFGFAASNLFVFNTNEKKKYFLVDCTQELFTIDTKIPENGFFQDASRISKDMMYIHSVTYGIRVLASFETNVSERSIANEFNASYNGLVANGKLNVEAYLNKFSANTTVKMYVVGGAETSVYPAMTQAELISVVQGIFKNSNYASAYPIKYTFHNMNGELVSSHSASDYFKTQNCTPKPEIINNPDRTYTATVWHVRRGDDDDWQLYGQIWAQVYDAQGKEIGSIHGNDRLLDIRAENHLSEVEGSSGYEPKLEVTFRIPAAQQPGASMTIWYWLNDYDNGSDDDFLSMRGGNKGKNKNGDYYFFRRIPLDDMHPGDASSSRKPFSATFTDEDGDSFTEVTGNIDCKQGQ